MAATDSRPVPIKNTAYRAYFPILDADGDLVTAAATLDSERSLDGATFADCTNEATEVATSSGIYFLDLTAAEMNTDCTVVIVKTGTAGAKTTTLVFYPEETGDINVDVSAWLGTAAATPTVAGVPEVDVTHVGGTVQTAGDLIGDTNDIQARLPAVLTADGNIKADTLRIGGTLQTANDVGADVDAILVDTGTTLDGRLPAALVGGRIDASVGAMAADVLTASAVAADAATEIRSLASGTADSGTTTTMVDAARTEADVDYWKGARIAFTSGTLLGQSRLVTAFDPATDTITFAPATTVAVGTHTYELHAAARADLHALLGDAQSGADLKDFADAGYDPATNKVQGVVLVDTLTTYTGNTPQTGDSFARLGAPAGASIAADLVAIEAQTDDIGAAGAGLTAVPWNAAWDAEVQSEVADALEATIADSIPADGTTPSVKQALYMLTQFMLERSVSGTTCTVKKADGTTTLLTLTLSHPTAPTSITRAT